MACSGDGGEGRVIASATIGPEGGRVEGEGVAIDIPAGAVSGAADFSISISDTTLPGHELLSPIYHFEPDGLEFGVPLTLTLSIPEGEDGVVFWSSSEGTGYDVIGWAEGGQGTAEVTHFSEGGAGECGTIEACTCRATDVPGDVNACMHDPCRSASTGEGRCPIQSCTPSTTDLFTPSYDTGYVSLPQYQCACFCQGTVTYTYSNYTDNDALLCRRPFTNRNGGWYCESDIHGAAPPTAQEIEEAETEVPVDREDYGLRAWVSREPPPEDTPDPWAACAEVTGSCGGSGYWIDYSSLTSPGANREASGTLVDCSPLVIEHLWRRRPCAVENCAPMAQSEYRRRMDAAVEASFGLPTAYPPEPFNYGACTSEPVESPTPEGEVPPTDGQVP